MRTNILPAPSPDVGNLLLRVGTGIMMFIHGWPKITGDAAGWEHAGAALAGILGIHFWPVVWGFLVALLQTLGGALIAIGFLTRPFSIALSFVMTLAAVMVYQKTGGDFKEWSHPAESAITCLAIAVMGAGRFALDSKKPGCCLCAKDAPPTT